MRKPNLNADCLLGIGGLVAGCLILFVWIQLDVETGLMERVRGRVVIGDSMAPSLAAVILVIASLMLFFQSLRSQVSTKLSWNSLKYLGRMLSIMALAMVLIRYTGPIAAKMAGADYRSLRDTVPWKYLGYCLGGTTMVFSLISMMEGRMRLRVLVISVLAVVFLMLMYDLPFKNLLLPPNGDV